MAYDQGLADRIRGIIDHRPGFSERKMFGGICFMLNGNMCCGVLKTDLIVKLSEQDAGSRLKNPHVRLFDFSGKPMKSMLYVSPAGCDSDATLHNWVEAACAFALQKAPKKSKTKKKTKTG